MRAHRLTRIGLMMLALLAWIPMASVAATAPDREQACRVAHPRAAPDNDGLCWLERSSAEECARLSGKFWPPDSSCGFAPRARAPAAAAEPQDLAGLLKRAFERLNRREYDAAIADFAEVLRRDGLQTRALFGRGVALTLKGDEDRAIADFSEIIRRDPSHVPAFRRRADAYVKRGDHARALADYDEVLRLEPTDEPAAERRAEVMKLVQAYPRLFADSGCSEAEANIDWVLVFNVSAGETYDEAILGGKSPIDAVIAAQGHNPEAQAAIARCRDWGERYIARDFPGRLPAAVKEREGKRVAEAAANSEARNGLTVRIKSLDPFALQLRFYTQDRRGVWPSDDTVWTLADSEFHSYRLSCTEGEMICVAAWRAGNTQAHWGFGYNGRESCPNCCYRCGPGVRMVTLEPHRGPAVVDEGGGSAGLSDFLDALGSFAGVLGNGRQAAPTPRSRGYAPPIYTAPAQAPGRGGAKIDCALTRTC